MQALSWIVNLFRNLSRNLIRGSRNGGLQEMKDLTVEAMRKLIEAWCWNPAHSRSRRVLAAGRPFPTVEANVEALGTPEAGRVNRKRAHRSGCRPIVMLVRAPECAATAISVIAPIKAGLY
jgi:hypothetical protein